MIPKIICFIFGHKLRDKMYHGPIPGTEANDVFGRIAMSYEWYYYVNCPRCGKSITGIEVHGKKSKIDIKFPSLEQP